MSIKYKWLAGKLKEMTEKYRNAGIEKLPTEQELCSRYHVSRQTVRQALSILEDSRLREKTGERFLHNGTFYGSFPQYDIRPDLR